MIEEFVTRVLEAGAHHHRDFAWRRSSDPYAVLVSEIMLQQTQVSRVERYYDRWMADFPDVRAVADAPLEAVLRAWQGLGYNRRAIALKKAAEQIVARHGGVVPADESSLLALPGVGPATAAGVRAFAYGIPGAYLETNVRTVVLHELYPETAGVPDREVLPVVQAAADEAARRGVDARTWNYALLDYGANLKRTTHNPSRRSAHHARQSRFEGSNRQKRAWLLREVLEDPGLTGEQYAARLAAHERDAGREAPSPAEVLTVVEELVGEGIFARDGECFRIAGTL